MKRIEVSEAVKALLDPDEILKQEFEYAREAALQANSDRAQVVNLFLLLVGGVGSIALALPQLTPERSIQLPSAVFAVVFFLIGLLGLFTVFKLIRLRQAWHDSVLTMNRIKDFYLAHYPELAPAFRWRTETIPPPGLVWTITFDLAMLVALIDSLAVGGGMFFLNLPLPAPWAVAAALAFFGLQTWLYFWLLGWPGKGS
jgi:hypothetical protein